MPIFLLALVAGFTWAIARGRSSSSPTTQAPVLASGRGRGGYTPHANYHHPYPHPQHYPHVAYPPIVAQSPTPIQVLAVYARAGQMPPAPVIVCAIAEAELAGRYDIAQEIVRRFGTGNQPIDAGGYPGDAPSDFAPPAPSDGQASSPTPQPSIASAPVPAGYAMPGVSDDEMRAAYAAMGLDPRNAPVSIPPPSEPGPENTIVAGELAIALARSPIAGIDNRKWGTFVEKVEREAPTYSTPKHVGRFRQRRERLVALGLDPDRVSRSSDAQLDALEQEMADAYQHARQGDLIDYVGQIVDVPQAATRVRVTLSGLLGLIQAAGLEGACEWLERSEDRKRFPHTTAAFLRTNGVF